MKVDIKLTTRGTQVSLKSFGEGVSVAFRNAFKEEMDDMAEYARGILEEASRRRTGKKYWTGTLQSAIKSSVIENSGDRIEGIVGVDPTVEAETKLGRRSVVEYDVPVEKGHDSFEGYHYMENTYVSLSPGMAGRIAKKLRGELPKIVKEPWAFREVKTGRFVSAPPGEKWPTYK